MTQKKNTLAMQASQQVSPNAVLAPEPMTGAQASWLKSLADEAHDPEAFQQDLSKREASRRIDALMEKVRLCALPPHTD